MAWVCGVVRSCVLLLWQGSATARLVALNLRGHQQWKEGHRGASCRGANLCGKRAADLVARERQKIVKPDPSSATHSATLKCSSFDVGVNGSLGKAQNLGSLFWRDAPSGNRLLGNWLCFRWGKINHWRLLVPRGGADGEGFGGSIYFPLYLPSDTCHRNITHVGEKR